MSMESTEVLTDDEWGELVTETQPQRRPNRQERRDALRLAKRTYPGLGRAAGFGGWRS